MPFDREILSQGMAFPIVGKQNAPQIWMPCKLNPEQYENFGLQPIRDGAYGIQRIHDRIVAGQTDPDTDFLSQRWKRGDSSIVAGLHRETVNAGGIGQQVKLKPCSSRQRSATLRNTSSGDHDGGLTAEFNYFLDRVGAPCAQASDYNISGLTTALRHRFRNPALRRLGMPVERAFFPQIDVSDQEDGDVNEHLHEAVDSNAV